MEQTQSQYAILRLGEKNTSPAGQLKLVDLPDYKLGPEGNLDAFHCENHEWVEFIEQGCRLDTTGMITFWTYMDRRDLLNWMLEEGILKAEDGRLIPVVEANGTEGTGETTGTDPRTPVEDAGELTEV